MTRFYLGILWPLIFSAPTLPAARPIPYGTFISPTNGETVVTPNITITWKGCSTSTQTSYLTRVNGINVTTTPLGGPQEQCPDYSVGKTYSASGNLHSGANTLYLQVCDIVGCGDSTITVYYSVPAVSVTPDGGTAPSGKTFHGRILMAEVRVHISMLALRVKN